MGSSPTRNTVVMKGFQLSPTSTLWRGLGPSLLDSGVMIDHHSSAFRKGKGEQSHQLDAILNGIDHDYPSSKVDALEVGVMEVKNRLVGPSNNLASDVFLGLF